MLQHSNVDCALIGDVTEVGAAVAEGDCQQFSNGGYNSYGAQELDSMGLPAMLLEEAPNPALLSGEFIIADHRLNVLYIA